MPWILLVPQFSPMREPAIFMVRACVKMYTGMNFIRAVQQNSHIYILYPKKKLMRCPDPLGKLLKRVFEDTS